MRRSSSGQDEEEDDDMLERPLEDEDDSLGKNKNKYGHSLMFTK